VTSQPNHPYCAFVPARLTVLIDLLCHCAQCLACLCDILAIIDESFRGIAFIIDHVAGTLRLALRVVSFPSSRRPPTRSTAAPSTLPDSPSPFHLSPVRTRQTWCTTPSRGA